MSFSYIHPKNILVQTLQRLYDLGMTTTSGGNLSIKDDDGNIWITPSGIDKGSLRPEDIVKVTPDGTVIGKHRPSCELPFHRSVYGLREDVKAVLHAHSPALVAFSLTGRMPDPNLIPGAAKVCGKVAFAHLFNAYHVYPSPFGHFPSPLFSIVLSLSSLYQSSASVSTKIPSLLPYLPEI
jgi:L-fuculose-phosphate aldolase